MTTARPPGATERTDRGPGRKVRTADCRACRVWQGLLGAGIPPRTAETICQRMWLNRARKRQILYLEGNRATHLYAVRRGTVKLVKLDAAGREHVTAILDSGSLFGLEAAFEEAYATGAEAHTDCELCLLAADELRGLMAEAPGFLLDLARYLHQQLVSTQQRQAFLGNPGSRARLAGYLLWRLPEGAEQPPVVPHELTLRELGGILSLSPETVCRTIGSFETEGVIEVLEGRILIRDPGALVQLAAG